MKPYYEQDGITIYHGDCRDVIGQWEGHYGVKTFDLLLTDPPYGININKSSRLSVSRGFGHERWDSQAVDDSLLTRVRNICRQAIIWGGNYYRLPTARCFLIWDKENQGRDFADCEYAWTTLDAVARIIRHRPMNMDGGKVHPTQKPEAVIRWCLTMVPLITTVFDPFMGSGTTLVAAKYFGREAIGIEREEHYCEIAAKRLAQGVLPINTVMIEAVQEPLLDSR